MASSTLMSTGAGGETPCGLPKDVVSLRLTFSDRDSEAATDADRTFNGFLEECFRRKDVCPLAKDRRSSSEIRSAIDNLLEHLRSREGMFYRPIERFLTPFSLRRKIFEALKTPMLWDSLARMLNAYINPITTVDNEVRPTEAVYQTFPSSEAFQGTQCGDSKLNTDDLNDIRLVYVSTVHGAH